MVVAGAGSIDLTKSYFSLQVDCGAIGGAVMATNATSFILATKNIRASANATVMYVYTIHYTLFLNHFLIQAIDN